MSAGSQDQQVAAAPHLSIGDVAERAGVSPGLLRMWETRFGFPAPTRLPSGHRRYSAADIDAVKEVLARQQAGLRLDKAIATVQAGMHVEEPSIFAAVRSVDPRLPRQRLRKSTLMALSWAIEDEMCARGRQGYAFGAFQRGEYFAPAEERWRDLTRRSRLGMVLADFPDGRPAGVAEEDGPIYVPLSSWTPMREEWAVVCDSPAFAAVLTAWEPPGQSRVPGNDREFEAVWTLDPAPVRTAARICVDVADAAGALPDATAVRNELAASAQATPPSPQAVTEFCDRVIGYLDRWKRR